MGFVSDVFGGAMDFITGGAISDQKNAARDQAAAQRESNALQQRIADINAARERRDAVRQARISQGQIVQAGAATGTSMSSGVAGATASNMSQLGSNLSYLDTVQDMSQQISIFNQKAADAQSRMFDAQLKQQTVMTGINLASKVAGMG
jgi:hypothetical protein